jgi:hypothetical protein
MRSLEEPDAPRGRGLLWILLVAALGSALAWYAVSRATPPSAPLATPPATARTEVPTSRNERPGKTERPAPAAAGGSPSAGRANRTTPPARSAAAARPETPGREFRVTSDIPGAYVFLDRKFLGTTPFTSRDVPAGTYQVNVQLEGRPPVVRTVTVLAEGPTDVEVTLPPAEKTAAAIDADVAVVHNHAVGSCEGTLRASADGFRYDTPHKDAFSLPSANVETFAVDYAEKRLRLKQRGGRTWNFTTRAATADPLFVFHRDVNAARP